MFIIFRHSVNLTTAQFQHYRSRFLICRSLSVVTVYSSVRNFSAYQDKTINMSTKDYVNENPVFNRKNVHIKDRDKLNNLLNKIICSGVDNLQIVFDFDRTLTKQHEEGKEFISSFGIERINS